MDKEQIKYDKLEDLPSLKDGWVRLVHRCRSQSLGRNNIANIKENGLIFNRTAAEIPPFQRGGVYDSPGYMTSPCNEELFWQTIEKDEFMVFDDAKYADTKIIFDMPMDEYCFLEKFGRTVIGKIDKKYIVGIIPNYNGYNKQITLPKKEVLRAKKISINNPSSNVIPTPLDDLIATLQQKFKTFSSERIIHHIQNEKEDIEYDFNQSLQSKPKPLIAKLQSTTER